MSCRSPVTPHFSSSSPKRRAYARMAVSTASMCLRNESIWVHSHMRSQASSRFTTCPMVSPLSFIRNFYDAAGGVRLLDGARGFAGGQDDLEVTLFVVPFLDPAGELLPFQVELEALGDLAAEHFLRLSHRAEAGERGPGVPFQPDHDVRLAPGIIAESDLRRPRIPGCLERGGQRGGLLRHLGLLLRRIFVRSILFVVGAGPHEEQYNEQHGCRQDRTNSFGLDGTHERAF